MSRYLFLSYSSKRDFVIFSSNPFSFVSFNFLLLFSYQPLTWVEVKFTFKAILSKNCLSGYLFFSNSFKRDFVIFAWNLFSFVSFNFFLLFSNQSITCWEVKPTFDAILSFDCLSGYLFSSYSSKRDFVIFSSNRAFFVVSLNFSDPVMRPSFLFSFVFGDLIALYFLWFNLCFINQILTCLEFKFVLEAILLIWCLVGLWFLLNFFFR